LTLAHIELATGADPVATIIWMHGLGADGWDFIPIVRELPLPEELALRFIFPHAPVRPVTINGGMAMRAWYDIKMSDIARLPDERGIRDSQKQVEDLIARERTRGTPSNRVVLAGFSQGGAIALQAGLRHPEPLAGIVALSTYLTLEESLGAEAAAANKAVPILMAHGTQDPMIALARAREARAALEALGYAVEWKEYAMAHSVCGEEIVDIAAWLLRLLAAAP